MQHFSKHAVFNSHSTNTAVEAVFFQCIYIRCFISEALAFQFALHTFLLVVAEERRAGAVIEASQRRSRSKMIS